MIGQEDLLKLVEYKNGKLFWKVKRGGRKGGVGEEAGYTNDRGYRVVMIDKKPYYSHRLIWLYHYGYFPENDVDHINRDRSDNRIENLRETSRQCNLRNASLRPDNKSGVKGVTFYNRENKWIAYIRVNNKNRHLYIGEDLVEAIAHRLAAEQALGWSGCESTSPAYLYIREYNAC